MGDDSLLGVRALSSIKCPPIKFPFLSTFIHLMGPKLGLLYNLLLQREREKKSIYRLSVLVYI